MEWYHIIYGIFTTELVGMQQSHYTTNDLQQPDTRWATNLIKKMWNITQQLWIHRNDALRNTDAIHRLSGLATLKKIYHLNILWEKVIYHMFILITLIYPCRQS